MLTFVASRGCGERMTVCCKENKACHIRLNAVTLLHSAKFETKYAGRDYRVVKPVHTGTFYLILMAHTLMDIITHNHSQL